MRAVFKLIAFIGLILLFVMPAWICNLFSPNGKLGLRLLQHMYYLLSKSWQLKLEVTGKLAKARPLLLVSNHCSYLDVAVLGQLAPVRFTPKQDVRGWPVIGYLCKLSCCVFIDRRREKTSENKAQLIQALKTGSIISLFPEGTTNDGSKPLPFKSSFFSLAEEKLAEEPLLVQPISIGYFSRDGKIFTREQLDKIAWYGDAEFVPHLWDFFHTQGALVKVEFHQPMTIAEYAGDRKLLAQQCHLVISETMAKKERLVAEALPNNGG